MIFAATTFFHLVNLKELPTILTAFLTFQLDSGMHCRTFFGASFFFFLDLRLKYGAGYLQNRVKISRG